MEEPELIRLIRNGDDTAFEKLFRLFYERLCRYASQMLDSPESAEEVVQDVFVTVWENRAKLELQVGIKPYLYRSVHNRCLNNIRHLQVRAQHKTVVMSMPSAELSEGTPQLETKELQSRIAAALEKLPEECRKVFKLSRYEELSYREIADFLEISVKTVENQMGKALKIMRKELSDYLVVLLFVLVGSFYLSHNQSSEGDEAFFSLKNTLHVGDNYHSTVTVVSHEEF